VLVSISMLMNASAAKCIAMFIFVAQWNLEVEVRLVSAKVKPSGLKLSLPCKFNRLQSG